MADNNEISKAFAEKLSGMVGAAMVCNVLAMAKELKLFEGMAEISPNGEPKSYHQIAEHNKLKARYVREMLNALACADIVEVDETGEQFWIMKEKKGCLIGDQIANGVLFTTQIPSMVGVYNEMKEVCKKDGPLGLDYSAYGHFSETMGKTSEAMHKRHLISDFIPLTGMKEKLDGTEVIECLDVGCGNGFHVTHLAEHYPHSNFTGIDITLTAIRQALATRSEEGKSLHNTAFYEMNGSKLRDEWSNNFDWVMMFDACHDQHRPDLSLKEIYRVLKPGGVFTMIEVDGTSNVYDDKKQKGELSAFLYSVSFYHCLPIGSNSEDALCLGNMWGQKKAVELLKAAGFEDIQVIPTPFFELNVMYKCTK
uniref:Methyltranfer_dom domain-containing protein n=1 Tax=Rhabditophanes sp. KR3021 TaxID=114890 RepID=A0AC35TZS1_9BILA